MSDLVNNDLELNNVSNIARNNFAKNYTNLIDSNTFNSNLEDILKKRGAQYKIKNLFFKLKENSSKYNHKRCVFFISLKDMSDSEKNSLNEEYNLLLKQKISFPLKENPRHLFVRFENMNFNFGWFILQRISQFRIWKFNIHSKATLETIIPLSENENNKLNTYIKNIKKSKRKVLKRFDDNGSQYTVGTVNDNKPIKAIGHNCSSWISTAPIGENNEAFLETLGTHRDNEVGTNPGWWTSWLLSCVKSRSVHVIYWDTVDLNQMLKRVDENNYLKWNFNRR